jgi:heterodisulfide reductase subunit A2
VESAKHKGIEVITNTEVVSVTGEAGDFTVTLERKPWYVDIEKCSGCGSCVDVCPITVPHEWEQNLKPRKAIYAMFPQAAPLKYVIDRDHCIECGLCMQACLLNAIDLSQGSRVEHIEVGAIVLATGGKVFDPSDIAQFNYGELDNVVTNMEFERICNAGGPTEGELVRPDGKQIKSVAFVQCVGSRDLNHNPWCSFFCCMASVKGGRLVMEHAPGASVTVFFNDLRACGKGFEELYKRSQDEGMKFVRAIPSIHANRTTNNPIVVYEDSATGTVVHDEVDLAVLACGIEPSEDADRLCRMLGVPMDSHGFVNERHATDAMVETRREGIFVAGVCQGPKDIPDAATQGSAVASKVGAFLSRGRSGRMHEMDLPPEEGVPGRERIPEPEPEFEITGYDSHG